MTDYLCVSCGLTVDSLNELTGWCARCTQLHYLERGLLVCSSCGVFFKKSTQFRFQCSTCRELDWESRNADDIERWIGAGLPYVLAKKKVAEKNRPVCISCGKKIKNGTRNRHFLCRSTETCRRVDRRYRLYWYDHGMTKEAAIEKALQVEQERRAVADIIANLKKVA